MLKLVCETADIEYQDIRLIISRQPGSIKCISSTMLLGLEKQRIDRPLYTLLGLLTVCIAGRVDFCWDGACCHDMSYNLGEENLLALEHGG